MPKNDKVLEGHQAIAFYEAAKKFMDENYQGKGIPCKGYFRKNSYDWIAFELKEKKNQWKLTVWKHVQHEGFCRVRMGLPMNF